ncbi:hypothetical protein LSH36_824g02009 [Paralvinella palmiformis]|uniref:Anosmin-1 n=1 Tax=Paralvinella palmiformis TaxID=53620 RepID=A0AAD9J100_9ANNE|nr:hypothetical protein LSH36_824g02009 [Paralvinella palmiformis]
MIRSPNPDVFEFSALPAASAGSVSRLLKFVRAAKTLHCRIRLPLDQSYGIGVSGTVLAFTRLWISHEVKLEFTVCVKQSGPNSISESVRRAYQQSWTSPGIHRLIAALGRWSDPENKSLSRRQHGRRGKAQPSPHNGDTKAGLHVLGPALHPFLSAFRRSSRSNLAEWRLWWFSPAYVPQDHVTRVRRKQPLYDNSPADNGRVTVTVQLYGYRVTLVPHPVVYYSQAPVVCGDSRVTIGKLQCKSCSIRIKVGQQSHFSQDNNQLPVTCYNSHKVTRNQSYNSQLTVFEALQPAICKCRLLQARLSGRISRRDDVIHVITAKPMYQVRNDMSTSCQNSCMFLQTISSQRRGQCPHVDMLTKALCIEACLVDADCPQDDQKCCYNGCGHVCIEPVHNMNNVPLVPDQPQLTELQAEGAVLLEWNSVATNRTGPVLYIVWVRWNVGKHHSDAHMTHWQQITQTTDTSTEIHDISPGHWYQYQISAVNINGSRGASPPTRAFCLSREPTPPSIPVNLTEGDTLVQGNHVTVSVQWKPPLNSDLPVTRYKIFWNKRLTKQPTLTELEIKEHRQVIPGDQLQFDVPDLDPETTYLVQIQAICQYGDTRLKSDKASIYINTYPLSRAAQIVLTTTRLPLEVEILQTPPPLTALKVDAPFFQNGLLRANVSWSVIQDGSGVSVKKSLLQWSPDACIADSSLDNGLPKLLTATTQDQYFVIYELRFDCRYVVKLIPISEQGAMGEESRISFVTPSCGEVPVIGHVLPDCPTSALPSVAEAPANLHYSFVINSVNISAHLTWDPPLSDSPVTAYRVTWGQTLSNNAKIWDKNTVLTKVLNKDARSFQLQSLCEAVTYLVRIQALSRVGPGKVATVHFTAPVLRVTTQRDMSSSVLTQYEILEQPSGHGENQVGKFPVTSEPHSWSQNGAKASYTSSRCLQIFCVFLSIIFYHNHVESFQFVRETVHKKRKSSSIRTHSRNRIALPD